MITFKIKYDILNIMKNISGDLKIWTNKIKDIIKQNCIPENCEDLISEYFQLSLNLLSDKNTPPEVIKFLLSDNNRNIDDLPDEYTPLQEINTFYEFIKRQYELKIKETLFNDDFPAAALYLSDAVRIDIKNVELFNLIADSFIKNNLHKDLIELYRTMFIYTTNPEYFERMGDVYVLQEDYNAALDAYLDCAESSDETVELYEKLADVFGKINDNDSRLACLEHIKVIEAENGK